MSENIPTHSNSNRSPKSLDAFKNLPSSNHFENWQAPEPEQVKALINLSGLNKRQWAKLLGVTYSEKHGSSTIRKWCMQREAKDFREVPYSTWRLMLIYSGVIDPDNDLRTAALSPGKALEG